MSPTGNRQQRALEKARQVLLEAEQARQKSQVGHQLYEFVEGNKELLRQAEFSDNLGAYLFQMYQEGRRHEVLAAIPKIGALTIEDEVDLRERAVASLSKFAGLVAGSNDLEILVEIYEPLTRWYEIEDTYINGYGVACSQLHRITQRLLETHKYWSDTEPFLVILHQIQDGLVDKSNTIRGMAVKLLDSLATKPILEVLVNTYLTEKQTLKHTAETLLINLGRRSVVFMLNRLMHSESKEERLQLIKLIPGTGNVAVPVLVECLKKKPPWYVIRNIVFIISELNNGALYSIVRPYLAHPDMRVQQQVLSCLVKISGNKLKDRLTEALGKVHDELKMQIIMQLGQMSGDDVAQALLNLLKARSGFAQETYIELLVKICVSLKFCSTQDVIPALKELIEERKTHAGPADPVIVSAQDTLMILEPRYRHKAQSSHPETDLDDEEFVFPDQEYKSQSIQRIERSVKELVAQGDLEKAGQKLFANAVTAARDKDFASAELLRDKLLEINPMALSEVIRLGEIIEEEKSSSITNHHIAVWSELYEKMTTEEFNALYYAMRLESYAVDEPIVRAGETDQSLYFINSGTVRLTCKAGNHETFLKRLQPGEVVGVDQFFSASVWTVSMNAQSETQIHVLSGEAFAQLKAEHPGLEAKLYEFCQKYNIVADLLKMTGADRREYPRYNVSVIISNMLLDPYGNAVKKTFRGELVDISRGGLCFSIHISSRENARTLLGRQIVSEIKLSGGDILKCFGVIVGVKYNERAMQDFSVHVKFYRTLDQAAVMQVVNLEI